MFSPIRPAQTAESRDPLPHQMCSGSVADLGSIESLPEGAIRGSASTTFSPLIAAQNRAKWSRAMSAPRGSEDPV